MQQRIPGPVLAGEREPGDLRHAHPPRRPRHHRRPPPRPHRPGTAVHDPPQPVAFVIANLAHPHPASHTRQHAPGNPPARPACLTSCRRADVGGYATTSVQKTTLVPQWAWPALTDIL